MKYIPEEEVKKIFFQILLAVAYLHDIGVCHRDIKPDNFIFAKKGDQSIIKMIDFGLSKQYRKNELTTLVGTPYYVAPELFKESYSYKCDLWSIGVMLFVMLSGKPPFYDKTDNAIFKKILKCDYNFKDPIWKQVTGTAKNLIKRMLVIDPEKRMSPAEALSDPWFQEINLEQNNLGKNAITVELIQRLTNFRNNNGFQKQVIKLMVTVCDDPNGEIEDLRNVFFYLDYLNNGTISDKELGLFFKEIGEQKKESELKEIIDGLHLRQSGLITYTEFIAATIRKEFFTNDLNLNIAFRRFDIDNSGEITAQNMEQCFARFGIKLKKTEIDGFIADFDLRKDGVISREEFFEFMKRM